MLKRKIVYLISLIFVIWLYIIFTEYLPFLVLVILLVMPVLLLLYTFIVSRFISVDIQIQDRTVIRGDKIGFEIKVSNNSVFPVPNITLQMNIKYNNCSEPQSVQFVVNNIGMDNSRVNATMVVNYCGILDIGFERAYLSDLLQLFHINIKKCDNLQLVSIPNLVEPDNYSLYTPYQNIQDSQHFSKRTPGNDSSEIFDVREYREGDNVSRVHWKLSAKEDTLIIKQFSMPIIKSDVILIELFDCITREDRKNLDGVFEMAYAIGNFARMKERIFKIAFYSTQLEELKVIEVDSKKMLIEAIHMLIQEGTYSSESANSLQEFRKGALSDAHRVYYITSQMNDEITDFLDQSKEADFIFYCIDDGSHKDDFMQIEGALLYNVDRNNIKQSLNTIFL